jgi:hypothetical protein
VSDFYLVEKLSHGKSDKGEAAPVEVSTGRFSNKK